jgi:hypothetical protein
MRQIKVPRGMAALQRRLCCYAALCIYEAES